MKLQKEKGITLLSLIITIILLLIVSAVTLNIALGDNGLIKSAKNAVNKSRLAQREEAIKMDLLSAYIDAELTGMDKPSNETIKEIVESHGGTIDESNPNIIKTPDGEIKLDDILNESSSGTQNPEEINKIVEELNNQINELKSQLAAEESRREGLETQIGELQTQVASWKKKAEDGEVTIEEKNAQISNLNDQITAKNQELDDKNNEIQNLNEDLTTVTGQKNTLETQVANLESQINEQDEEIANKEEIIASKETTITSLNTQIEELNTSITSLNSQLEAEKVDKKELEEQVTNLNTQVASWKKEAEDNQATINEKNTEISNLNDQITDKNEEITTKANTIKDLQDNITTLTNEKKSLETQVASLNTQIANLQKKQATGDATVADVLAGKTFSNASGVGLTGTMVNRGTLNFNPSSSTSQTIESGYYEGGTLDTSLAVSNALKSFRFNMAHFPCKYVSSDDTYAIYEFTTDSKDYKNIVLINIGYNLGQPMGTITNIRDTSGNLIWTSLIYENGSFHGDFTASKTYRAYTRGIDRNNFNYINILFSPYVN